MSTRRKKRKECQTCGISRGKQAEILKKACRSLDDPAKCRDLANRYAKGLISARELVNEIKSLK